MSMVVFIVSSQARFRLQKSDLIMLNQVNVGLRRGRWVLILLLWLLFYGGCFSVYILIFDIRPLYVQHISFQESPLECTDGL